MKKALKKLMAAMLAVAMVMAMAIPAFAAAPTSGDITVGNAVKGHEYKIYRILDLETNDTVTAFKYKANGSQWEAFIAEHPNDFETDSDGYVTWKNANTSNNSSAIQAIANAAGQYAKDHNIAPDATVTGDDPVARNLPLGYYLVVSDLTNDALCSLDTTKPDVTINEKNGAPSVDKEVEYASGSWGDGNDGNVGDTVNFRTTIHVTDGNPTGYVLHDKMDDGLSFTANSIVVKKNGQPFTAYTVAYDTSDDCTFEITFNEGSLAANDTVEVTYSAVINSNAVVGSAGNQNETWLKYGNDSNTTHDTTKTYTWSFNIFKFFTDSNNDQKHLAGAEFVLYRNNNGTIEYAQFTNGKLTGWTAEKDSAGKLLTNDTNNITVEGLDAGTYYLEETTAPSGYNKLTDPVEVVISSNCNSNQTGSATISYKTGETYTDAANGTIPVENMAGTTLPSTGGIGTTIFYVIGGGLMVVAAVLLITKKRMEGKN